MSNKLKLALLSVLVLVAGAANAAPKKGDSEIAVFGNLSSTSGNTTVFGSVNYGYFASDKWLWDFGLTAFGSSGGGEDISFGGSIGGKYHFNTTGDTAYVRAAYRAFDFSESDSGFADIYWGYNWYVGDNAAFFWEVGYGAAIGNNASDGVGISNLGVKFYLQ